ncbi:MAG: tetratricopeptide repeat protein [Candidatus Rokubacteria bacterium]|nr:tetratricopeptide repeat protein [Candidatus Rokubacteria bacterium]
MGNVHLRQGRYAEALNHYQRSVKLAETVGNEPGLADTMKNIGDVHRALGHNSEALASYERAARIAERLGLPARDQYRRLRDETQRQVR